jgi:hypothetical protein
VYNNALATFTAADAPIYFPGAPFLISASLAALALITLVLLPRRDQQSASV